MSRQIRALVITSLILGVVFVGAACGGNSRLADLRVTLSASGWSPAARTAASTRYVPVVQLAIANTGSSDLDNVDVFLSFWPADADGEKDTQQIPAARTRNLDVGTTTPWLVVRSTVGYDLAGESADLFAHSRFRDWSVKIYARRAGRIVPLGDFPIARRLVGALPSEGPSMARRGDVLLTAS